MAGQVLEYDLEYREDGEVKKDRLKISFVSNYCSREYNDISQTVLITTTKWEERNDVVSLMAAKKSGGEVEESIEELEQIHDNLVEEIRGEVGDGFFNRRFKLLEVILKDNGYKDSPYMNFEFWDRNVEPSVMNDFLEQCAFKDIPKKKM